ncbi:BMC domain protein [Enterococcus sp. 22-H-5-01]|uniref:BMC domain protein n=1 Tax=Enterococcus sp. 22-H-5-01 TaxID=3418555 RepID=UPI003CFF7146
MDFRIIKSPSSGTLDIVTKRIGLNQTTKRVDFSQFDAIGLIQGKLIDMICAADLAEKSAGILAVDVRGSCPQNMILLALFGDTVSVETAVNNIKQKMKK